MQFLPEVGSGNLRFGGCVAVGTNVYCAPFDSPQILKIDTADGDSFSYLNYSDNPINGAYTGCSVAGTNVYCAPFQASYVMKIDTSTDSVSMLNEEWTDSYK
jgi:DNA-binding beta-propeller fold protein YncE